LRSVAYFLLVCVASGCGAARVREFLGEQAVAILSNPQSVEVYRVRADRHREATQTQSVPPMIGGYVIIAESPRQDAAFGCELAAIFLSPQTYDFNSAKLCIFQPDTLLRVYGPGGSIDLVTCFHCDEFGVTSYDAAGNVIRSAKYEDFDGMRDQLAALVERATGVKPYRP
jgi:alkanesulfonate monooxygenase SsuD/methylene tetrahydromethanopterin reductase-like flavin-dependent oxidoreductase (luciferase family)